MIGRYFINKGMARLLAGDRGMAYAYTAKALLTDSGYAPAWNNLGVLFSRLGVLDYAENAFFKVIEMELLVVRFRNDNPYYHQFLAVQGLNDGNYEQAIEHLDNAVARKHNELAFYHELAIAHQKLGHDDKVIQNLHKARRHAKGIQKQRFRGS
ncbi:MAG: Tfp pilus assembly protein PilF [Pseudohongiellaceae bacterium]|jgi:Tfp pilus assembly protein PilF